MKKLLLLAAVFIGLSTGCKKTTVQPNNSEITIVGKWLAIKSIKIDYTSSPKKETITYIYKPDNYYIFNTNGTGQLIVGSSSITLRYQLNGTTLKITNDPPSNQVLEYGVSELKENNLTLLMDTQRDNTGKITSTVETGYTRVQ